MTAGSTDTAAGDQLAAPPAEAPAAEAPAVLAPPSAPSQQRALTPPEPVTGAGAPPIQRPDAGTLSTNPPAARFDTSLDELERRGVVTRQERRTLERGTPTRSIDLPRHRAACAQGALSERECRSGLAVRLRDRRSGNATTLAAGASIETIGTGGDPYGLNSLRVRYGGAPITTPLTVPVSALLAGEGAGFSLSSVFAVTPRPAPLTGNNNSSLLFPLIGSAITTSRFGWRIHPVIGSWLMHSGRDLAAPQGTPVVAALDGRVLSSGLAGGYGIAVELDHSNPRRRTLYGHLSEIYVKAGDRVRQGEVIGRVGSTGLSTGPHLHFELREPAGGGWVAVPPGELDLAPAGIPALEGSDAVALLMGQLLDSLRRDAPQTS
ncbi:M23 family metallopeptidase [Synechococcus sp. RSCCF101]|nr:M23 family metallopeptidase [Synechococcus sp. RSCCF101]QEY33254.1 M23 family metallopeptidase [Synechococcus sp. RSCCF101]